MTEIVHVKNVMNVANDNNLSGAYPLFLGEDMGFSDGINVTYPELVDLAKEQRGQYWQPEEHSLAQDKLDFREDPKTGDIMVRNLMSQWLMDSVAARSIMSLLEPFISNNEMFELVAEWMYYETIHSRTYAYILREAIPDNSGILERAKADVSVTYRSRVISKVFNETYQLAAAYSSGLPVDMYQVKLQLLKTFVALFGLESIGFMNSFSCTFAITETGKYQGIGNEITAIMKDEMLHGRFGKTVLDIMRFKEGYEQIFQENKAALRDILVETCKQELSFAEYIFSEGRRTVGCNTDMLCLNTAYLSKPAFDSLDMEFPYDLMPEVPTSHPLPYMEKYMNPDMIQSAAQEITLTNYLVAKTVDDVGDSEFDF